MHYGTLVIIERTDDVDSAVAEIMEPYGDGHKWDFGLGEHDESEDGMSTFNSRYQICDEALQELIDVVPTKQAALEYAKREAKRLGHNVSVFDLCAKWGAIETSTFTPSGDLRLSPKMARIA